MARHNWHAPSSKVRITSRRRMAGSKHNKKFRCVGTQRSDWLYRDFPNQYRYADGRRVNHADRAVDITRVFPPLQPTHSH